MARNRTPSVKANFVYNVAYQILSVITPLITAPYLSRVLGAELIGVYSYTYSIACYFVMLSVLGRSRYANRLVARTRDDDGELSRAFSEIAVMQLLTGVLAIAAYGVFASVLSGDYRLYFMLWFPLVVSAMLDVTWLFFGLEEFRITVFRNFVVRIATVAAILLTVKSTDDLGVYVLINSVGTLISQLSLWPLLRGRVRFVRPSLKGVGRHVMPNLLLFLPVVGTLLYNGTDKVMLGILSDMTQVGFYEYADKLANLALSLITAMGTVMLPRMTNTLARGTRRRRRSISRTLSSTRSSWGSASLSG